MVTIVTMVIRVRVWLAKLANSLRERTAFSSHISSDHLTFNIPVVYGDPGASRTHNLLLRTELLYPLSYRTMDSIIPYMRFVI